MSAATSNGSVPDDIDARPGSTASLLRTFVGLYLRRLGGWMSTADLIAVAAELGIPDARARTGIARLKQRGLLAAERRAAPGYALNPDAVPMLERGDRRIFAVRVQQPDEPWCLVSFSVPESRRDLRHQLRRRLQWIGCGTVSPALWICPAHLQGEAESILADLDLRDSAVLFRAEAPLVVGGLRAAVARWWDLDALRAEHERFLATLPDGPAAPVTPQQAFSAYVHLIDDWRVIPYLDPGLAPELLPADWPGWESIAQYHARSALLAEPAWEHLNDRS